MKTLLKFLGAGVTIVLLLLLSVTLLDTEVRPSPDETPGYVTFDLDIGHRDAPLSVHVWYPAARQEAPTLLGQNALFYGHYAQVDADAAPSPAPLVVLSHGSGGNAVQLGWFAAGLASEGFVVAAPNHLGTMSQDSDPHQTPMIWQRARDLSAVIDAVLTRPDLNVDPAKVASAGFSLGGFAALSVAGVQVSKAAFIEYCEQNAGLVDCGWMQEAGVDFTAIDQALYEADYTDPRILRTVTIDPALPQAMTGESLETVAAEVTVLNLGQPDTIPTAMRADQIAQRLKTGHYHIVDGAAHFSMLPECSPFGWVMIGVAGDDNICSDPTDRPRGDVQAEILSRSLAALAPLTTQ